MKSEKLAKAIQALLSGKHIKDHEMGGVSENEVAIWTLEKSKEGMCIVCNYLIWFEKEQVWAEKSCCELEGPALLNCPIRFFKKTKNPELMFPQWRYEVKKYHEQVGNVVQDEETALRLIDSST